MLQETVRVSVLSLFHPKVLRVDADGQCALTLEVDGQRRTISAGSMPMRIIAERDHLTITFHDAAGSGPESIDQLHVDEQHPLEAHRLRLSPASENKSMIYLAVPGKLRRPYIGVVEIQSRKQQLEAVVTMPLEIAVASIVEAESPSTAGIEALKAQAVAARSFLVARESAHIGFDFCDTTHCQFLRSPPSEDSLAAKATKATAGLVLTYHDTERARDTTLAAMYFRSCSGTTRTLQQIGLRRSGYPYFQVKCTYCSRHPELWKRDNLAADATTEQSRIAFNRVHGWTALPSLPEGAQHSETISGKGIGHGVGLCQSGSAGMAREGADYATILSHYYPNTRLVKISSSR